MKNMEKFSRQMILPFVGEAGQEKLNNTHIVVVGCGGLGCPLLLYLAASGIGNITIIDHDTVSMSNLHRQILFSHHDIGQYKAVIAAEKLMMMHPDTHIIPITQRLDTALAESVCSDADLVIDGTDSFLSKYILSEICPILLTASVVGMKGYIAGFTKDTPYRMVFPTLPDNPPNCNQTGVLGSVAGLMGTFLATEALKIILNHHKTIIHNLMTLDFNNLHFSRLKFSVNLSKNNLKFPHFEFVTLQSVGDSTVIDIREPHELIDAPLIPNSFSMPLSQLKIDDIISIPSFILKCQTGRRAQWLALKIGLLTDKIPHIKIIVP